MDKDELFFAKSFIQENFHKILVTWMLGDIKKCCRLREDWSCDNEGALVAAFMLWCCAIDHLGGLLTSSPGKSGTKGRMKSFISKYMKQYNPDLIYELRWSLLHFYSPHNFILMHENDINVGKTYHLQEDKKSRCIFLHLGTSIYDLERAIASYNNDLNSNDNLKINMWKYYKTHLPIKPIDINSLEYPFLSNTSIAMPTNILAGTFSPR